MKKSESSERSSGQQGKKCFCQAAHDRSAKLAPGPRAALTAVTDIVKGSQQLSEDGKSAVRDAMVKELQRAINAYPSIGREILNVLPFPLTSCCERAVYLCAAKAAANIARESKEGSLKVVDVLSSNLVGNDWLYPVLATVVPRAPEAVLEVLYDNLRVDSAIALVPAVAVVIAQAKPGEATERAWLRSPFPGPCAAMLRNLSKANRLPKEFPAMAKKALDDPDANLRAVVAKAICHFTVCDELKWLLRGTFSDSEPLVRHAGASELRYHPHWIYELLPDLSYVVRKHWDRKVRDLVGFAIGCLKDNETGVASGFKIIVQTKNAEAAKAARNGKRSIVVKPA